MILFYNLHPNGAMDHLSLHGGCDVIQGPQLARTFPEITPHGLCSGEKWSANFWIWNQPVTFGRRELLPQIWGPRHTEEDLLMPPGARAKPREDL